MDEKSFWILKTPDGSRVVLLPLLPKMSSSSSSLPLETQITQAYMETVTPLFDGTLSSIVTFKGLKGKFRKLLYAVTDACEKGWAGCCVRLHNMNQTVAILDIKDQTTPIIPGSEFSTYLSEPKDKTSNDWEIRPFRKLAESVLRKRQFPASPKLSRLAACARRGDTNVQDNLFGFFSQENPPFVYATDERELDNVERTMQQLIFLLTAVWLELPINAGIIGSELCAVFISATEGRWIPAAFHSGRVMSNNLLLGPRLGTREAARKLLDEARSSIYRALQEDVPNQVKRRRRVSPGATGIKCIEGLSKISFSVSSSQTQQDIDEMTYLLQICPEIDVNVDAIDLVTHGIAAGISFANVTCLRLYGVQDIPEGEAAQLAQMPSVTILVIEDCRLDKQPLLAIAARAESEETYIPPTALFLKGNREMKLRLDKLWRNISHLSIDHVDIDPESFTAHGASSRRFWPELKALWIEGKESHLAMRWVVTRALAVFCTSILSAECLDAFDDRIATERFIFSNSAKYTAKHTIEGYTDILAVLAQRNNIGEIEVHAYMQESARDKFANVGAEDKLRTRQTEMTRRNFLRCLAPV